MKYINEFIVVEFSVKQQAFHKETVDEMIGNNLKNIIQHKGIDYLPIGIFKSNKEADQFISGVYDTFKKTNTDLQQDAAINFINNL